MKKLVIITMLVWVLCAVGTYVHAGDKLFPLDIKARRSTCIYHQDGDILKHIKRGFKMTAIAITNDAGGTYVLKVEYGGFIFKDVGYVPYADVMED